MKRDQATSTLRYREKFRGYQLAAISMFRKYRNAFSGTKGKKGGGAALVYHPTGTGKTAVIAGIAHCAPEIGNVLILVTREAIRDQLTRELGGRLFVEKEKFGLSIGIRLAKMTYVVTEGDMLRRSVKHIFDSTSQVLGSDTRDFHSRQFARLIEEPENDFITELRRSRSIVIMTVQMLVGLWREDPNSYKILQDNMDVVLFDEGHYEPAAKYSASTRSLNRPIALMSATPFRNDLKPFEIQAENIHIYKFATAVDDGNIRDIEVIQRQPTRDHVAFCRDIVEFSESKYGANRDSWPRIIIHCDDVASIERLGEAFIAEGFEGQIVGIHDQFSHGRTGHQTWHHQSVPPPRETDALIWIHQYKLMEGIDDHRFRILAFFDPLKNVRSIVQQIGRVIRTSPLEADRTAIVLDHYHGRIRQYWELYKAYDKSTNAESLTKTLSRYYLDVLSKAQPEIDYIERKFRRRLDLRVITAADDEILFDRKVTLKRVQVGATLDSYVELVNASLEAEDYEYQLYSFGENTALFVVGKVQSPNFLNNSYFAEAQHGALLLLLLPRDRLLAISTVGSAPVCLSRLEPPTPDQLDRLVVPGEGGRISIVSSKNTNLGSRVVRRRTISAPSVADIPPILDEYGHVVSSVIGYNGTVPRTIDRLEYQESVDENFDIVRASLPIVEPGDTSNESDLLRRYVGIATGRVSEQGPPLRLKVFREWVEVLAKQMRSGSRYLLVYNRYAQLARAKVRRGVAKNLLLDIFDISDHYVHKDTRIEMRGDDLCVNRLSFHTVHQKPVSRFKVTINDKQYEIDIAFNQESQRYRLESPELDKAFVRKDGRSRPLGRELNESQSFSVVPDDRTVIYVHGRFYAPGLKFGSRFSRSEFFAGHCLYPSMVFKNLASEKGALVRKRSDEFDPKSLFNLIDTWKNGFDTNKLSLDPTWTSLFRPETVKFVPTLCICDDTNKESADFILADSVNRRVVLVHAKASKSFRPFSASAIQEVAAQAQKNVSLFSTFSLQRPGNFSIWGDPHRFVGDKKVGLIIKNRIRKPLRFTAEKAWAELSELLYNPLTSREVWLVLGNMLSADHFHQGLQSDDPEPETLQLSHLLQTTIAAAASVAAKTRIFCSP